MQVSKSKWWGATVHKWLVRRYWFVSLPPSAFSLFWKNFSNSRQTLVACFRSRMSLGSTCLAVNNLCAINMFREIRHNKHVSIFFAHDKHASVLHLDLFWGGTPTFFVLRFCSLGLVQVVVCHQANYTWRKGERERERMPAAIYLVISWCNIVCLYRKRCPGHIGRRHH